MTEQRRILAHPINRTAPNARNPAVKPTYDFVPLDDDKQLHPLVCCIKYSRICPRQPPQILPIHAELLRSPNDVAEVLTQSASRSLVAKMRKRRRPPRKHRHQRSTRLGQLGLQSGPGPPRRLKIRLATRIDNGFSFPRRSHLSRTILAFSQRSLKPQTALHLAPQSRGLEPQRLFTLKHRAKFRNAMLGSLSDAHRISAWPNSAPLAATRTNDIVEMQPQRLRPLPACRANEQRPCPPVRKLQQTDANDSLNMAELNKERRRLGRDAVRSPQAASPHGWQMIAVLRYHRHG